jgi:hypothetical protein
VQARLDGVPHPNMPQPPPATTLHNRSPATAVEHLSSRP